MRDRSSMIGYNRRVELPWIEHTARMVCAGYTRDEIYESLVNMLKDELSAGSRAKRGSREKTITLLLKTWVTVPKTLEPFRADGLSFFNRLPKKQHLTVHWGMSMAAYPFFLAVAAVIGRLLRLQESFTAEQVKRRIREQYGEREMAVRSSRYVVNAFKNWGVIKEGSKKGVYRPARKLPAADPHLIGWLIEAVLLGSSAGNTEITALVESPALFPFKLDLSSNVQLIINKNERLEITRHALDEISVRCKPG